MEHDGLIVTRQENQLAILIISIPAKLMVTRLDLAIRMLIKSMVRTLKVELQLSAT